MANDYFSFKQFTIWQDQCAMKVSTDACLFGAWISDYIQKVITESQARSVPLRIADVGAGTGLLSLMIHQKNSTSTIEALEIDAPAAEQARQNIAKAGAAAQLKVVTADVTTFLPSAPYDIIVSNPPFYQDDLKAAVQKRNWAFHDETLTLSQLFLFISQHLQAGGYFFLLLPARREQEAEALLRSAELTKVEKIIVRTNARQMPHRMLVAGQRKQTGSTHLPIAIDQKEICITSTEGSYSTAFTDLLKDYYLAL
jgi:tRNA1Val (adenine37-N6)-methyltransferase